MDEKKREYRYRLKEEERDGILVILADWLKRTVKDFRQRHEKEIQAYHTGSMSWSQRQELYDKIIKGEGETLQRIEIIDALLQKMTRTHTGRPWIKPSTPIENHWANRILKLCSDIQRRAETGEP